jgi:hypothetical protein
VAAPDGTSVTTTFTRLTLPSVRTKCTSPPGSTKPDSLIHAQISCRTGCRAVSPASCSSGPGRSASSAGPERVRSPGGRGSPARVPRNSRITRAGQRAGRSRARRRTRGGARGRERCAPARARRRPRLALPAVASSRQAGACRYWRVPAPGGPNFSGCGGKLSSSATHICFPHRRQYFCGTLPVRVSAQT